MNFQQSPTFDNLFFKMLCSIAASLIWKEDRSSQIQYLLEILSNLQMIAIIRYGLSLCSLSHSDGIITTVFENTTRFLSAIDALTSPLNLTSTIVVLVIISFYFSLMLCVFGFASYRYYKNIKITNFFRKFYTYWAQLHHTLIFWLLNIFLMTTSSNKFDQQDNSGILIFTWSILLVILNYLFGGLSALFCYDPFFSNNAFASHSSTFQNLAFLYKSLVSAIIIYINDTEIKKWSFIISSLIFALWRQEILFLQMSFYKFSTLKLVSQFAGVGFVMAIVNLIAALLSENNQINTLDIIYIQIATLILILKLLIIRMNNLIYKYGSLSEQNIKLSLDVFKRIIAVSVSCRKVQFFSDAESNKVCNYESLFVIGKMSAHNRDACSSETCMCYYLCHNGQMHKPLKSVFDINKVSSQSRVNLILGILTKAIKSLRHTNRFKILMSYILLKEQGKFCAALLTLFSVNVAQQTLEEKVLKFYLIRKLEQEIGRFFQNSEITNKNRLKSLNMKRIVDFEKKSNQMFTFIKKNTQTYLQLWESFLNPNTPLYEFYFISVKAEKEADEIQAVWNSHFAKQKHLSLCICLYVTYLTLIRNQPSKAEKIITHHHILQKNNESTMLGRIKLDGSGDVILYVSVARETLGKTLHVSRSVCREFGWNQSDIINKNIKIIQPPFIKERHDQILIDHIEKPKNQPDQSILISFVRRKEGYCIPVHIHVTIFPYVNNEPIYASMIQRRSIDQEFMVIEPSTGTIEAFSEGIWKTLRLTLDKRENIKEICPEFDVKEILKENESIGSPNFSRKEIMLKFERYLLEDDKKSCQKFLYKAKIDNKIMMDQNYLCLYLTEKDVLKPENAFPSIREFRKKDFPNNFKKTEASTKSNELHQVSEGSLFLRTPTYKREKCLSKILPQMKLNQNSDSENIRTSEKANKSNKQELSDSRTKSHSDTLKLEKRVNNDRVINNQNDFAKGFIAVHSKDGTVSSKEKIKINEKLEEAIIVTPKEKYMKILDYLITIYAIICSLLMGFTVIDNYSEFASMLQKMELTKAYHMATVSLVNTDESIRLIDLLSTKYISETQFDESQEFNWSFSLQTALLNNLNTLNQHTRQILESFSILDEKTQITINTEKINIKKRESIGEDHLTNGIQAFIELTNTINTIVHFSLADINTNQSDVQFLLDNALDDPLSYSERTIDVIIEDAHQNLFNIKTKIFTLLPLVICSGICVVILLLVDINYYTKKRDQLIEILFKIDQEMLRNHLGIVSRLNHSLQNDVFHSQLYIETKVSLKKFMKIRPPKAKSQKFSKNTKRLNNLIIKGIVFTTIATISFASAFLVLSLKFDYQFGTFLQKIDELIRLYKLHLNFNLFGAALLEYISENNSTTVKNLPISKALNELSDLSLNFPNHLEQIVINGIKGESIPLVHELILQDICQFISLKDQPKNRCRAITEKIGAKNLLEILNFLVSTFHESKSFFDQANHTPEAGYIALNSKNQLFCYQIAPFFKEAMFIVKETLKEDLGESVFEYRKEIIRITVVYGLIYLIIGLFLSKIIWKNIETERSDWRKVIRQIPLSIASSNKLLKMYIIKNCNNVLDSFKNMI